MKLSLPWYKRISPLRWRRGEYVRLCLSCRSLILIDTFITQHRFAIDILQRIEARSDFHGMPVLVSSNAKWSWTYWRRRKEMAFYGHH